MQRAKFTDRKRLTHTKIMIGEAAERAGAIDLDPEIIEAILSHYVKTGGEPELNLHIEDQVSRADGGSAASRRGAGEEVSADVALVDEG